MNKIIHVSVGILYVISQFSFLGANDDRQIFETAVQQLTNKCLNGLNHKKDGPGPEDSLHYQCNPWSNRSCCTVGTSVKAHSEHMYNFDWSHCSHVKTISEKCRRHFTQDLCFYECSPNVGPWLVKVDQKIRKQRFINVPLCQSDCEAWFHDCKNDFTCTDNWGLNFNWKNGRNQCPVGSTCKKFDVVYNGNASYFCETIWDHSWKVVDDKEHCMRLWFNNTFGNPNDAVAKWKAEEIVRHAMHNNSGPSAPFRLTALFILIATLIFSKMTTTML